MRARAGRLEHPSLSVVVKPHVTQMQHSLLSCAVYFATLPPTGRSASSIHNAIATSAEQVMTVRQTDLVALPVYAVLLHDNAFMCFCAWRVQ